MKPIQFLLFTILLVFCASCFLLKDKEKVEPNTIYPWVVNERNAYYDIDDKNLGTIFSDYRILRVEIADKYISHKLRIPSHLPQNSYKPYFSDENRFVVKPDGLYYRDCHNCGACVTTYTYLRLQRNPELESFVNDRVCNQISNTFQVTHLDTIINTKLGSINCFVLEDTASSHKSVEYWNNDFGLVQLEVYNRSNALTYIAKLSKVTDGPY